MKSGKYHMIPKWTSWGKWETAQALAQFARNLHSEVLRASQESSITVFSSVIFLIHFLIHLPSSEAVIFPGFYKENPHTLL